MNKLLSHVAILGLTLLAVSLVVGLTTASLSFAQGNGQGAKPTSDVNVINTPNVNVSSLPDVHVGNDVDNPVPVAIDAGTPVVYRVDLFLAAGNHSGGSSFLVPPGKLLVIESVDFVMNHGGTGNHHLQVGTTFDDQPVGESFYAPTVSGPTFQVGHALAKQYHRSQFSVLVNINRDTLSGSNFTGRAIIQGRLFDAP